MNTEQFASELTLIEAAEIYASNYNDDDRQDIKTDVLNAFYAGSKFAQHQNQRSQSHE